MSALPRATHGGGPYRWATAWSLCLALVCVGCGSILGTDVNEADGCSDTTDCRESPVRVPGVPALVDLSAGSYHTCGLTADGVAWCWGGVGTFEAGEGGSVPAPVPGDEPFVDIGAGRYHNCALTAEGIAYCWTPGESGAGLCGPTDCSESPVALGERTFGALAVGGQHNCALDLTGAAWCWGFNWMGETGSPRLGLTERDPVLVSESLSFVAISASQGYTCALTAEGALYCWGWGDAGQLGVEPPPACGANLGGSVFCSAIPVPASTSQRLVDVSTGNLHACALTHEGRALCWGDNGQGQLGDERHGLRMVPGWTTDRGWSAIAPGLGLTCGIETGGAAFCWGLNRYGQVGSPGAPELSSMPQRVAGGHTFTRLSSGLGHVCALDATGGAYCWGDNSVLQLGGR